LVQAFPKKWWVESDFKAPNLPLSLRFRGMAKVHGGNLHHIYADTEILSTRSLIILSMAR
jgi:hypothetical protein